MLLQTLPAAAPDSPKEKPVKDMLARMCDTCAHRHTPTELAHSTDAAIYGPEKHHTLPEMDSSLHA